MRRIELTKKTKFSIEGIEGFLEFIIKVVGAAEFEICCPCPLLF